MFFCQKCQKEFGSKFNLDRHLQRLYPCDKKIRKRYQCQKCEKIFKTKKGGEFHLKHDVCQKTICLCIICGMQFSSIAEFNIHQDQHKKNEPKII